MFSGDLDLDLDLGLSLDEWVTFRLMLLFKLADFDISSRLE